MEPLQLATEQGGEERGEDGWLADDHNHPDWLPLHCYLSIYFKITKAATWTETVAQCKTFGKRRISKYTLRSRQVRLAVNDHLKIVRADPIHVKRFTVHNRDVQHIAFGLCQSIGLIVILVLVSPQVCRPFERNSTLNAPIWSFSCVNCHMIHHCHIGA